MKFLDLLAKLGILRFGATTGTYRNGTERPTEFMMDDVYDAERDLVTGKEAEAAQTAGPGKSKTPGNAS